MTKIVAHRGASTKLPENTLPAIQRAVEIGADAVEFDVRQTADSHLVLLHDRTMDRTTDGTGAVGDMTLKEVRRLSVKGGGQVPTLDEVLDYLEDRDVEVQLELKEAGISQKAFRKVAEHGMIDQTMFISFNKQALKELTNPNTRTGYLSVFSNSLAMRNATQLDCDFFLTRYRKHLARSIDKCSRLELKPGVWTVNHQRRIRKVLHASPHYLTTDRPEEALVMRESIPVTSRRRS